MKHRIATVVLAAGQSLSFKVNEGTPIITPCGDYATIIDVDGNVITLNWAYVEYVQLSNVQDDEVKK